MSADKKPRPLSGRLFRRALTSAALACLFAALVWGVSSCEKNRTPTIGGLAVKHQIPPAWTELSEGLDFTTLEFVRREDDRRVVLYAIRIDPRLFAFKVLSAPRLMEKDFAWVREMRQKAGAIAAWNASFYLPGNYEPIGLLVSDGVSINPWKQGAGSGVFTVSGNKASIEWARDFREEWEKAELAVQAGPLVIEPGKKPGIYKNSEKYRARTAVGIDGRGFVVALCTGHGGQEEIDLSGLDLYELMMVAITPAERGGLELKALLNLDGGTSTAMSIDHPAKKMELESTHPVRNGIGIFARKGD